MKPSLSRNKNWNHFKEKVKVKWLLLLKRNIKLYLNIHFIFLTISKPPHRL